MKKKALLSEAIWVFEPDGPEMGPAVLPSVATNVTLVIDEGEPLPLVADAGGVTDLTVSAAKPVASIAQLADYLVNGFWQYNGTIAHHFASNTITYNINALNSAEQFLAVSAMQAWHDVANINFVQTSGAADLTFSNSGSMQAYTSAAWYSSGAIAYANIVISSDWITNDGGAYDGKTGIDSYGYQTYIHEIGHALGLGHQGPYNGSASYSTNAIYANDTWQYSIMSYFPENNYSGSSFRYVVTPQMADIYAMGSIYGASSTRTGDTIYGFNSNAGPVLNFGNYTSAPALTIYDSGGNDTLDCSNYSNAQLIDLRPGAFSSVGGLVNNIGIALSAVIEKAIGGAGNDTLIAGSAGSTLSGSGGSDTLIGGAGSDRLIGGSGVDTLTGGGGSDTFVFAFGASSAAAGQHDRVTDFASGIDRIDLSAIDAIASSGVLDVFHFIGAAAFSGVAGELSATFNGSLGVTMLAGDTNGDGIADFIVDLVGNVTLAPGDLLDISVPPPQPDLSEYVAVSSTTIAAGGNVTIDAYNMNLGNGVAGLSTDRIYISSDAAITTSDTVLATLTTSGTLATVSQNGYYDHQTISVTLPGNLAPGTYYIGGIADYANLLSESNEGNNTYNAVQVTVTAPQQADLSEYVAVSSTTIAAGGNVTIDAYNMNLGNGVAGLSTDRIYISSDAAITTSDTVLATLTTSGTLARVSQNGYYDHQTVAVTLPGNLAPGTYYIGGIADYANLLSESNEGNNTYNVVQVTVTAPQQPDLSEYVAVSSTTIAAGGNVTIDAYNMNLGNGVAGLSTDRIYISSDAAITTSDTVLATLTTSGTLARVSQNGYYDHQTVAVTLPGNLAPGTYYIGGIADYANLLSESNEGNNTYNVVQVTVTAPQQPDLSEYVAVSSTTIAAGGNVTIDAYNMNLGNGVAGLSTDRIYISSDAAITTSDTVLATLTTSGTLATVSQNGYYDHQTISVTLPGNLAPGTYYIGGIADYANLLSESNEGNNTYNAVQVTVTAPTAQQPLFDAGFALANGAEVNMPQFQMNDFHLV